MRKWAIFSSCRHLSLGIRSASPERGGPLQGGVKPALNPTIVDLCRSWDPRLIHVCERGDFPVGHSFPIFFDQMASTIGMPLGAANVRIHIYRVPIFVVAGPFVMVCRERVYTCKSFPLAPASAHAPPTARRRVFFVVSCWGEIDDRTSRFQRPSLLPPVSVHRGVDKLRIANALPGL